jgi:SWI/SNF-related matrix-associated actin-dependent regulator of chromatin subfamily A-like protein 1
MPPRPALLPFQRTGALFLGAHRRALLADEQRVGKTPQAIHACDVIAADSVLVLCPAIARTNWLREFGRFSDRTGVAIVTAKDPHDDRLTVCSYDNLIDESVYARLARNWDVVVLDEAHFCKNLAAKRSQAAYGIANGAKYAWALSATPAPGNAAELWALLSSFGLTRLDYWGFVRRYCKFHETPFGVKITGNKNAAELREKLARFTLRRTLAEVAPDMPPIRWSTVAIDPGDVSDLIEPHEMAAAMEQAPMLAAALAQAGEHIEQIGDTALEYRRLVGLQKVRPIAEMVAAELDGGVPNIVIFAWHKDVIEALAFALRKYSSASIHGGTLDGIRTRNLDKFRNGEIRVLVCQIIAAGTAIDLSVCDDLLFVEMSYTPGDNDQAAKRCVSQFKKRPVRVRIAYLAGSVDEDVQNINARKIKDISELFGYPC